MAVGITRDESMGTIPAFIVTLDTHSTRKVTPI